MVEPAERVTPTTGQGTEQGSVGVLQPGGRLQEAAELWAQWGARVPVGSARSFTHCKFSCEEIPGWCMQWHTPVIPAAGTCCHHLPVPASPQASSQFNMILMLKNNKTLVDRGEWEPPPDTRGHGRPEPCCSVRKGPCSPPGRQNCCAYHQSTHVWEVRGLTVQGLQKHRRPRGNNPGPDGKETSRGHRRAPTTVQARQSRPQADHRRTAGCSRQSGGPHTSRAASAPAGCEPSHSNAGFKCE